MSQSNSPGSHLGTAWQSVAQTADDSLAAESTQIPQRSTASIHAGATGPTTIS